MGNRFKFLPINVVKVP